MLLLLTVVEASQRGDDESWRSTLRRLLGQAAPGETDSNASDGEGAAVDPAAGQTVEAEAAASVAPATPPFAATPPLAPPTPMGPEDRSRISHNVDRYRSQNSDDGMHRHSNRYSPYETYRWEIANLSTERIYLVDPAQDWGGIEAL